MSESAKTETAKMKKNAEKAEEAMMVGTATLREMTERGMDQAKTAYEQMKGSAEETVELLDGSADAFKTGSAEFNAKAIEYAQNNVNAGFEFARKLVGARDVKEVVELQSAFARDQFHAYSNQMKDLGDLSVKVVERASKPIADGVKKSFDNARHVFPSA